MTVGHADWKTTLEIYTQVSLRSVDPSIRDLLRSFLDDRDADADLEAAAARSALHQ